MRHTIVFVVGLWRLCGAQMPQPTDATGSRTTPLIQDVRSSLRSASAALPLFDTQGFIYNRSPHLARSIEGKYRRTLAGLVEGKYDSEYLIQLLYDPQPRVRTLAMALLFQKDDPKLLAYVSQLLDDSAETFPVPTLTAILLDPMPTSPQTVGEVAKAMVGVYMRAAGMKEWRAPGSEAWTAYQTTHRSRPYYFSWFVVRLSRVTGLISPFQLERRPLLLKFRDDLDKLPAVDWDLYLLWLCHGNSFFDGGSILATNAELLDAAQRLGHRALLQIVDGRPPGTDPDLSRTPERYRAVVSFLLLHADRLLTRADEPFLAAIERDHVSRGAIEWLEMLPIAAFGPARALLLSSSAR